MPIGGDLSLEGTSYVPFLSFLRTKHNALCERPRIPYRFGIAAEVRRAVYENT